MNVVYLYLDIFGYRAFHFHYFLVRLRMRVDNHRSSAIVISALKLSATRTTTNIVKVYRKNTLCALSSLRKTSAHINFPGTFMCAMSVIN